MFAADHVVTKLDAFLEVCGKAARGGRARLYRHARRQADGAGDRLRLHPSRRGARRRRLRRRGVRREARPRDRRALRRQRLSLELRQFLFPRRHDAGGVAGVRAGDGARRRRDRRRRQDRSRLPRARRRELRRLAEEIDRLRGDGAHQARRGGAGRHRLVGRRQLGRGVEAFRPRRRRQFVPRRGRLRHRFQERPRALRRRADRAGRRQGRRRGDDAGRGAGARPRPGRQRQGGGRGAEGAQAARGDRAQAHVPALGLLPVDRPRRRAIRSSASS